MRDTKSVGSVKNIVIFKIPGYYRKFIKPYNSIKIIIIIVNK